VVIPARYGATRLPGKPLAEIDGRPMIWYVWSKASAAKIPSRVVVATDDERIASVVRGFGGEAVLTSPGCASGTDRVAVDAVGVAVLKELGSNDAIMGRKIFEQEQIKRAAELGLGISSPRQVELTASDETSRLYADTLKTILAEG